MRLSLLLEQALQEDMDRNTVLQQMVKNPETGQDITVKTALGYDKAHPARKAAAKIYAQFMQKQGMNKPQQPANNPKGTYNPNTRKFPQKVNNPYDSDDGFDAMRDRASARGTWGRGRNYDPYYDSQDYR